MTNAMQALSDANVRLQESMLAQERESETRKARLEVLEKFVGEKLNDAMLRVLGNAKFERETPET